MSIYKRIEERTRKVHRFIKIREHRCWWCRRWFETMAGHARYCPQSVRHCRVYASLERRGLS